MPARLFAAAMAAGLTLQPVQYSAGSRQQELHDIIGSFRDSARETVQARGPAATSLYDDRKVAEALTRAQAFHKTGQESRASALLEDTYVYVEEALIRLRDKESVVYDRTFRTPADEFRYLSGLYASYAQLVDQAAKGALATADRKLVDEARAQYAQAQQQSGKNAWGEANKSMDAAGGILLRVLESLGVMAAQ
ncbi:MAG: hypothetical protein H7Z12_13880 [Rhodospirillaceae bacterium]|nr:hypothetical protein [Rhodospirillales bacterium]